MTCSHDADRGGQDAILAQMRADWCAVARYSVYRSEYSSISGTRRSVLLTNRTYEDAREGQAKAEAALRAEPGYRGGCMTTPLIGIELEHPQETWTAYKELRAKPSRELELDLEVSAAA